MSRTGRSIALVIGMTLLGTAFAAEPASAAPSRVKLAPVLSGYSRPLLVANSGGKGNDIFIVEQGGKIKRASLKNGRYRKSGIFLDISDKSEDPTMRGEGGLLGLAFHPNYRKNRRFYVYYTRKGSGDAVLAEYRAVKLNNGMRVGDPASGRTVLVIEKSKHTGGHLAFGPDGKLYIGVGDSGGDADRLDAGQDLGNLWGSILRIDPIDPDGKGARRYKIPRSNPYFGRPGRNQIWASGTRNPWRYSFDRKNGNLWIGDPGRNARDEINKAKSNRFGTGAGRGLNFGWADCEGTLEFKDDEGDVDDVCSSHVLPIFDYAIDPSKARCSVIGGYVHRGPTSRSWRGLYVAGDYCGWLFVLNQAGKLKWSADSGVAISSFGEDAAGRMFATGIEDGRVYRVKLLGPRP